MWKISWKGVLAHKVRLGLTGVAIVLGVGFVAGSFVFTDTISATFEALFEEVTASVDVFIEAETAFGEDQGRISDGILDQIQGVQGVELAFGGVEGWAQLVDQEGEAIGGNGPPTLGFSWSDKGAELFPLRVRDGRPPATGTEIMVDAGTAEANDLDVGDTVTVLLIGGPGDFEIVGTVSFGDTDNLLGATLTIFELETAQRVFDAEGEFTAITVKAGPGVAASELAQRIGAVVPEGVRAITATTEAEEEQ
ncbi:MAG: ABC transporter permease, partial [Acidimicrobiia bacterium]